MSNRDKRIVCIGGGTGISTMLRGIKKYTDNLTAIVAVSDNGGSSGMLRRELNMLPPGDIRNCLLALADTEPIMQEVLNYRFTEGSLKGQSLGNLFIAALNDIYGNFEMAVEKANSVLAVKGRVLPVSVENINLCAHHDDDSHTIGESEIVLACKKERKKINKVYFTPAKPRAYPKALAEIMAADTIVIGPGSLYTSIIPNLMIEGISQGIKDSKAKVIYVSNLMTQPGETDYFTLKKHLDVIEEYLGKNVIDIVIVNDEEINIDILKAYEEDEAKQVIIDIISDDNLRVIRRPLVEISDQEKYIRHDHDLIGKLIVDL